MSSKRGNLITSVDGGTAVAPVASESVSDDEQLTVVANDISKAYLLWDSPRDRLKHPLRAALSRWLPIREKAYYHEFWALRDVSLELRKGETLGIIGRNGSGKSTLLQVVCGTLTPTRGEVFTRGRVSALLELGSGFNPEFTGRENVYMNATILGLSRSEIDNRYDDIVAFADIGDYIDQPVKAYSSGMFVRLAFAIAAHVDADIMIVDEALAVGDVFFGQKCMRFMRKFRERGSMLFVSHDTGSVINLCDSAILLENGAVKARGSAKDVCQQYLEDMFAARQTIDGVSEPNQVAIAPEVDAVDTVDQRQQYLNVSQFRNDIELFEFDPGSEAFGSGGARIVNVSLCDGGTRAPLSWIVGGERVTVVVEAVTERSLSQPILGFMVKDRLGQVLFSDNTYLTYREHPPGLRAGSGFRARFTFRMPLLPVGEYCIAASVADGTQLEHVQHHWVHEALVFRSHSSSVCTGLMGVPMESIVVERLQTEGDR